MKRPLSMIGAFVVCISLSGCGDSAEDLTKKFISQMNDLADAIEKKDEAKAKSLAADLKETTKQLKEKKVSTDEEKKLKEKYEKEIFAAGLKLGMAYGKNPEFCQKIGFTGIDK